MIGTTPPILETLRAKCGVKKQFQTPATIRIDRKPWTVATSGHTLVAVPEDFGFPRFKWRSMAVKMLTETKPHQTETSTEALLALTQLRIRPDRPKQPGDRVTAYDLDCTGDERTRSYFGWCKAVNIELCARRLNGALLYQLLHGLPTGPVTLEYDEDPLSALRLVHAEWRALLMPLQPGEENDEEGGLPMIIRQAPSPNHSGRKGYDFTELVNMLTDAGMDFDILRDPNWKPTREDYRDVVGAAKKALTAASAREERLREALETVQRLDYFQEHNALANLVRAALQSAPEEGKT